MFDSDLLDEYCENEFGHADWQISFDADGNTVVTFFKEARPEYLAEIEEQELYGDNEEEELRSERACGE